jgi:hypothetical protein
MKRTRRENLYLSEKKNTFRKRISRNVCEMLLARESEEAKRYGHKQQWSDALHQAAKAGNFT